MKRSKLKFYQNLIIISLVFLSGCAGYMRNTKAARTLFNRREFKDAAIEYTKQIGKIGNEELLALLDTAISYHYAGDYKNSIKYFLKADKLSEKLDMISVSRQIASLAATDYVLKYKGEDFEKILINTYLAMDYLMLGDLEGAMVEVRRINQKLKRYSKLCKCDYKLNPFSIYLSGLIFEMNGQSEDAYIDYEKVARIMQQFPLIKNDLRRIAGRAGRKQENNDPANDLKWRNLFGRAKPQAADKSYGELIVFFESGRSPQKHQETRVIAIPVYHRRKSLTAFAEVYVDGRYYDRTYVLNDIEKTAIRELKEKNMRMLAKQSVVTAGKIALAHQIGKETKNPIAGHLALMFFHATNKADTRSWLSLPKNIQLSRISLPAGNHNVTLKLYSRYNNLVNTIKFGNIEIRQKGKHFISYRAVQ